MIRVDLYGVVHKGLAAELFAATTQVAQTDFLQPHELASAAAGVRRVLNYLAEHAQIQTEFVLPALERVSPVIASEFHGDHARLLGLETTILGLLDRIASAPSVEVRSLGHRLHAQLRRLVAEHILHMEREETTANRALWAHLTDGELVSIRARILASIPVDRLGEWTALVMDAVSRPERAEIEEELTRLTRDPGSEVPAEGSGTGDPKQLPCASEGKRERS